MLLRELLEAEQAATFPPLPNHPGYVDWLRTVRTPAVGSVVQYDGKRWTVDRIRPNRTQTGARRRFDDLVDLVRPGRDPKKPITISPTVEMIAREVDSGKGKIISVPDVEQPAKIRPDEI